MTQVAQVLDNVIDAAERFAEAARRNRKATDTDPLYAAVERAFKKGWDEQAADFKKEWQAFKGDFAEAAGKKPSAKKVNDAWKKASKRGNRRQEKALDDAAPKAVKRGAGSALKDLKAAQAGISFDLQDPRAIKYLKKFGAQRVTNISKTSLNRIKRLIVDMAEQGKSWGEVGKEIDALIKGWKSVGTGAIRSRGELIAVTEVGQAYEEGRQMVRKSFEQAGLKTEKEWMTVGDDRVCEICEPAEADGTIPGDAEFSNGLTEPLGHPGCRCDLSIGVVTLSI